MNSKIRADDRFHTGRDGGAVVLDGGKKVSLLGNGDGRHARCAGRRDQRFDPQNPVDQRILGVQMEVYESVDHGHRVC